MNDISLIRNWHEKAKNDYFSRYHFEYLAFEAFLKKYKYNDDEIKKLTGNTNERSYIQRIKNDTKYFKKWLNLLENNPTLNTHTGELKDYLKKKPLNTDKSWWRCKDYNKTSNKVNVGDLGIIDNEKDFINIIEYWYQVRNSFFHANQNPNNVNDEILVKYALLTLSSFVEEVLLPELENKTFYPATWESFQSRFFKGESEVQLRGNRATATVYELLFLDDNQYPINIMNKLFTREQLFEELGIELASLASTGSLNLFKPKWSRAKEGIKNAKDWNYFKSHYCDILELIKKYPLT